MKYVDEFRDAAVARRLIDAIRRNATRRWTIMEVCGGQTHSLLRHGIDEELADVIELIHGPGCPVCVTSTRAIDRAIELSQRQHTILCCFGDMLRVPGSRTTLAHARANGGGVQPVYSPLDAVALAARNPGHQYVMFGVGFETTAPATALAVKQADRLGLANYSALTAHVRVQPAMDALMNEPQCRVAGFLAAGHVCTVIGYESYQAFCHRYRVPVVVAGFEPIDLLHALHACVSQLERGAAEVTNCYGRCARPEGNAHARSVIEDVYEVCDADWRGIGRVPQGGLRLKTVWRAFDVITGWAGDALPVVESTYCRSGEVLAGRLAPTGCEAFGARCTPDNPLGAPMVSSEGACAAYFRYHGAATRQA